MVSRKIWIIYFNIITCAVWEGEYCQNDADGCEYTICFDDVTCTDNPAPMTGATCGPCPEGYSGNGTRCNGR